MRLSIIAGAFLGTLCAAKQSPVGTNATEVTELFQELAGFPTCIVSIATAHFARIGYALNSHADASPIDSMRNGISLLLTVFTH